MRAHQRLVVISALIFPAVSKAWSLADFQLPFLTSAAGPGSGSQVVFESVQAENAPLRIAIIGAGAGGSSAAYWISKAAERHERVVHVDVFEKSDYIGGRSTVVYPHDSKSLPSVELGASIFVEVNRNMMRAAKEFNLTLSTFESEADNVLGIWNGQQILIEVNNSGWWGWFDNVKMLWRYGYSSLRKTPKIVGSLIEAFKELYTPSVATWPDLEELGVELKYAHLSAQTAAEYMTSQGVGELFIHEFVEALTRVNYGQNSDEINALMGTVSMATDGAVGVLGGNFQVFEQFLNHSDAKVHLNTKVTGLSFNPPPKAKWTLSVEHEGPPADIPAYDHVIIAAPFASSGITILGSPKTETFLLTPPVEYVRLHVTLFTTIAPQPDPAYFNLPASARVPAFIATTHDGVRHNRKSSVIEVPEPEFNSLNYLYQVKNVKEHGIDEWAVKIFSKETITDEWLAKVFGEGKVTWVHRKEWDAYPKAKPTTEFPPLKAAEGLWYVNAFEPFISTMETETLSSRNIVDNIFEEEFAAGICPPDAELEAKRVACAQSEIECPALYEALASKDGWGGTGAEGRIYGWDC
ncbi:FAD/NAD(P)-binding domain-containing protein [Clavulina sp. PMI_390]|nr:FAD/NAD(P)-binding domain-containing protein [Clavulina sp. PMI_390]